MWSDTRLSSAAEAPAPSWQWLSPWWRRWSPDWLRMGLHTHREYIRVWRLCMPGLNHKNNTTTFLMGILIILSFITPNDQLSWALYLITAISPHLDKFGILQHHIYFLQMSLDRISIFSSNVLFYCVCVYVCVWVLLYSPVLRAALLGGRSATCSCLSGPGGSRLIPAWATRSS